MHHRPLCPSVSRFRSSLPPRTPRTPRTLGIALAMAGLALPASAFCYHVRHHEESAAGEARNAAEAIAGLQARVSAKVPRVDRLPREGDFHYECARLPGLPDTRLCLFNSRLLMNAALARPSYFSENERRVLSQGEFLAEVKGSRAEGFNLGAPVLVEFLRRKAKGEGGVAGLSAGAASAAPEGEGEGEGGGGVEALLPPEQVFLRIEEKFQAETLQPIAEKGESVYLLTAAVTEDLIPVLTHELQHAQFFHDAAFRRFVALYWKNTVPEADRAAFRAALEGHYDVRDEKVLLDEFQAYMVMALPPLAALEPLSRKHRGPLLAAMAREHLVPWAHEVPDVIR